MNRNILVRIIGVAGVLLILAGYYLLWIPPSTELEEVISRTRLAIAANLFGAIAVIYYLHKR